MTQLYNQIPIVRMAIPVTSNIIPKIGPTAWKSSELLDTPAGVVVMAESNAPEPNSVNPEISNNIPDIIARIATIVTQSVYSFF